MSSGSRIAQLRTERQWSQTHLARMVGTNVKTIKDWENDVSFPTAINLKKLCSLFATTADYLLEIDNTPVVVLNKLSEVDAKRARAIVQILIDSSSKR